MSATSLSVFRNAPTTPAHRSRLGQEQSARALVAKQDVGVQICDLLASALIVPAAVHTYCTGHIANDHVQPGYSRIRALFTTRLQQLLYRYQDAQHIWRGGITVSDAILHRASSELFKNVPTV